MKTIDELEKYLEDECYSFVELTVGKHFAPEGIFIEKDGGRYNFGYSERGNKIILKSFQTEEDLVEYSLAELKRDKWSRAHLAAWLWEESEIKAAQKELRDMNIVFERNDIPNYRAGKRVYRIFVFGRDIQKLEEFKKKYFKI